MNTLKTNKMKQKQKPQTIELKTGLTCKIDKNGRVHVFNTKELQEQPKAKEGVYLALFFILLTTFILIKTI